jgi:hypothetical protein
MRRRQGRGANAVEDALRPDRAGTHWPDATPGGAAVAEFERRAHKRMKDE